ncbi:hypothetical protein BOTBODRAFT_54372 [Botryobasidium botryosum FD-172 SS1]|uniref:Peptidase S28 n=1 Tax=Botryobasidium botryosum (strain FD-172 SS1) TaxID=930990 RepID=A0A067MMG3_BOTB1|nr:hypothetical protein BOTBODRAFT_54372 [Botryobasidium botryosum FD-172 SS1]
MKNIEKKLDTNPNFTAYYFSQPVDHFDTRDTRTFGQRYWVSDRHYVSGGPVIVLDGGETSGEDRLPFLDTGIVDILAKATGGLGVVLEHRYYGESIPVADFSTDNMRWLTNAQALEDSARFMRNVKFRIDGVERDMTAPSTPWIYYGGSYAGARAAHMRVLYPDIVFGAIASSAVTHAEVQYWEYWEAIRLTADRNCIDRISKAVSFIDGALSVPILRTKLKALFGLGGLRDDSDFASVLLNPLEHVQNQNWDPEEDNGTWKEFCAALAEDRGSSAIGWVRTLGAVGNYARWIRKNVVSQCSDEKTVEECFGTQDDSKFQDLSTDSSWRAWTWQVCTEWGYYTTAPPDPAHARIVSKRLSLEYLAKVCKQAFPAGKEISVPAWPNVTAVNALGDFGLAADRLAFVDGSDDPWMPATPHSWHAPQRTDTRARPFKLIPGGVHHHDENGRADEPAHIRAIHRDEVVFVTGWLAGWRPGANGRSAGRVAGYGE